MSVSFLTPVGWLLALSALLPLLAFALVERRARRVRSELQLTEPSRRSRLPVALSLAAVPVLLAAAAAQPVLESRHQRSVRADAEAFVIFDTSRSMLAAESAESPTRLERAQRGAEEVRRQLTDIPVGVASMTNRLLPHLFPTIDNGSFISTVERSIGIERPPPNRTESLQVTTFAPLARLQPENYFDLGATRRLAIVFTDGETTFTPPRSLRRALTSPPGVHMIFVHVADPDERVFARSGLPEPAYRADPASEARLQGMAKLVEGEAFPEQRLGDVVAAARDALGSGVTVNRGTERRSRPLASYLALAAFVPLVVILRRRNF